jgi:hypothetical protein
VPADVDLQAAPFDWEMRRAPGKLIKIYQYYSAKFTFVLESFRNQQMA